MSDLERLLDLQANDTSADQLRHRRATLPERALLVELDAREASLRAGVADSATERDALVREQKRLEDEIAMLVDKIVDVDRKLYGEHLTSPKEAQALQADLESLRRRQDELEEKVLEAMEAIEPLAAILDDCDQAVAAIDVERSNARDALARSESEIDAELRANAQQRDSLASAVSPALLADYDGRRASAGGVVVARLQGSTCQGCFLSLAPAEVDELRRRPVDDLVECPECGRILVR